jgi:hypothetical protein
LRSEQAQDVDKTIAYGSSKTALKYIAMSALVLVTGLVVAFGKKDWLLGAPLAALAAAAIVWQIHGSAVGRTLLAAIAGRIAPQSRRACLSRRPLTGSGGHFLARPYLRGAPEAMVRFARGHVAWICSRERPVPGRDRPAGFRDVRRSNDPAFVEGCHPNQGLKAARGIGIATFMPAKNPTASGLSNIFPTHDGKRFVALPP